MSMLGSKFTRSKTQNIGDWDLGNHTFKFVARGLFFAASPCPVTSKQGSGPIKQDTSRFAQHLE